MKKVLILEDDSDLQTIMASTLSASFDLYASTSIDSALQLIDRHSFEIALIDRVLPDGDGLEVISYLNQVSFSTKIITLSQLFHPQEKIKGLENGADDYLAKPFSLSELKLKVQKAICYEKRKQHEYYATSNFTFFPDSGEVKSSSFFVKLRKREAQILTCLFRYKDRVVSREILIDEVWNMSDLYPTQTTLDVYIRRIRLLLGKYGDHIETKRGFGYQLNDVLEERIPQ